MLGAHMKRTIPDYDHGTWRHENTADSTIAENNRREGGREAASFFEPIIEPSCMFSLEDFHNPLTTGRRKNIYFTRLGE